MVIVRRNEIYVSASSAPVVRLVTEIDPTLCRIGRQAARIFHLAHTAQSDDDPVGVLIGQNVSLELNVENLPEKSAIRFKLWVDLSAHR